jgi:hypothetical protein
LRHDSADRKAEDFSEAAKAWTRAQELDPGQYIFRRRIQQYGPRLEKPYAFYDWVPEARESINKRGDEPVTLAAEPSGSEFAKPLKGLPTASGEQKHPDPEKKVTVAKLEFSGTAVSVPAAATASGPVRVHVSLSPGADFAWNNEAEAVKLWIELPEGAEADSRLISLEWNASVGDKAGNAEDAADKDKAESGESAPKPSPPATSMEERTAEFEMRLPKEVKGVTIEITLVAFANVCSKADGTCLYLRREIPVSIRVIEKPAAKGDKKE